MNLDQSSIRRWGGAALGIGSVMVAAAIVAYIVIYGQPTASDPALGVTLADRVSHLRANWDFARLMWSIEIIGAVLMLVAGTILQHQTSTTDDGISPKVAWPCVAVGAGLLFPLYPLMLAGYPEAARLFSSEPGLMAVLNDLAWFLFYFGTTALFLGLALAFALGSDANGGLPGWLRKSGVMLGLIGAIGSASGLFGLSMMMVLSPFGLLANLLAGYLGFSIWRSGFSGNS